jgi:hypothetical protein
LLVPAVERGFRPAAVEQTRQYDPILVDRNLDSWDSPSPLNVWCRHGVNAPDVARDVRRWRPRHQAA